MNDIIIKSIINLTLMLAIPSALLIIYLKMFYHYRYLKLIKGNDGSDNFDLVVNNLPIIVAPIILRDRDEENSSPEIAQLGKRIKNLIIIFFSLLLYFFVINQVV
jgi:hypothetical protein